MKTTTDLWFAAFLLMKGFKVKDFERQPNRRTRFTFDLNQADWKELKLAFIKSDVSKAKQAQEELKDLLY